MEHRPDLVEWRGDFLKSIREPEEVAACLSILRQILKETPLLFTIRTKAEGGEQKLSTEEYEEINQAVIGSGLADAVDVELFLGEQTADRLIASAHAHGMIVIGYNHDFEKTPEEEEMVA